MGKTRDLFKKIRHTKGTFHEKMGLIKHRNGSDLTEAEDIKKRWQEYRELYKKDLHDSHSQLPLLFRALFWYPNPSPHYLHQEKNSHL